MSVETLRKEAFMGKEMTEEQYDQMQKLAKAKDANEVKEMGE